MLHYRAASPGVHGGVDEARPLQRPTLPVAHLQVVALPLDHARALLREGKKPAKLQGLEVDTMRVAIAPDASRSRLARSGQRVVVEVKGKNGLKLKEIFARSHSD